MDYERGEILTLENNKEYVVVDTVVHEEENFVYLINNNDNKEILIQRVKIEDGAETLYPLKDKEEFKALLQVFFEKNKELFTDENNN